MALKISTLIVPQKIHGPLPCANKYSGKKKKLNRSKFANIFFPRKVRQFFFVPYSSGKNCLIIVGKKQFATPGPLSFFF